MIKKYLKRLIVINKQAILIEVLSIQGLMQLLMKIRNTDEKWTFLSFHCACRSPGPKENQKAMMAENRPLSPGLFCLTENVAFHILKLPAHPVRTGQARRGFPKRKFRSYVPLNPACKAGLAGHVSVNLPQKGLIVLSRRDLSSKTIAVFPGGDSSPEYHIRKGGNSDEKELLFANDRLVCHCFDHGGSGIRGGGRKDMDHPIPL
jgi:hypothetical protein